MANYFQATLYPLMARSEGGCAGCHGPESGRLLTMGPTGTDTFYRLRAGGYLVQNVANSLLDRVSRTDETAMPQGGPYWTQRELDETACFVEQLAFFESEADAPADESFPPELLEPYTGPASAEYDNTILTYEQLKGRIAVQFGDDWVRDGVDLFAKNIGLFGGVDFETTFVSNRQPTADYLLGLDMLATDVCREAVALGRGPFEQLDVEAPLEDEVPSSAKTWQAEGTGITAVGTCLYPFTGGVNICTTNNGLGVTVEVPQDGDYLLSALAKGQEAGTDLPIMGFFIDGIEVARFNVPGTAWVTYSKTVRLKAGAWFYSILFLNDYNDTVNKKDRNLLLDAFSLEGPAAGSTPGAPGAELATYGRLAQLFEHILLRAPYELPENDELLPLYELLLDLETMLGDRADAWAGVCEGLVKHPDFVFTRPPSHDTASPAEQDRLLLVKLALDLLNRPPTFAELDRYDRGTTYRELLREWLLSEEARDAYFHWMRLRLESDGSAEMDEPARLWTWMMLNDRPIHALLTADFTVDEQWEAQARAAVHGPTGVLTMAGYIQHKPGLPHYNYSARVLSDFLGYIFEVPPEIVDSRAGSSPSSTVEEGSVCYSCHYLLTPLAHQRLRWDDAGGYRDVDEDGVPIDDSDRGMVETYPFKGSGMASFAAQAVRKERFYRTMSNAQFQLYFARPIRADEDERELYAELWAIAHDQQGGFLSILETILQSDSYRQPVGARPEDQVNYGGAP